MSLLQQRGQAHGLAAGRAWPTRHRVRRRARRGHRTGQGQHLVQRRAEGDEIELDELAACRFEVLVAQVQPPRQRRRPVVAQALGVADRDQEQVQRGRTRFAAVDKVLLDERVVNPTELLGDLAQPLGPQKLFDWLHRGPR